MSLISLRKREDSSGQDVTTHLVDRIAQVPLLCPQRLARDEETVARLGIVRLRQIAARYRESLSALPCLAVTRKESNAFRARCSLTDLSTSLLTTSRGIGTGSGDLPESKMLGEEAAARSRRTLAFVLTATRIMLGSRNTAREKISSLISLPGLALWLTTNNAPLLTFCPPGP